MHNLTEAIALNRIAEVLAAKGKLLGYSPSTDTPYMQHPDGTVWHCTPRHLVNMGTAEEFWQHVASGRLTLRLP